MSGIFGVYEPGRSLPPSHLDAMATEVCVGGETILRPIGRGGAILGTAQNWSGQQLGDYGPLLVAADTDLLNLSYLQQESSLRANHPLSNVTDVIAALYNRDGLEFVKHLEGSFGIAIWDSRQRKIVLAVDGMGIKSLYWTQRGERLVFASRVAAVRAALPDLEVSPAAVMQFLIHSVVPAPLSIYRNVKRLEPGTVLTYADGEVRSRRYWDLDYSETRGDNVDERASELRSAMRRAVHANLFGRESESTGEYLSGGTDSSSVVAFATERHAPCKTFSIFFENPRYDEVTFARTAARRFNTRHHERCLRAEDLSEAIQRISTYFDEPFANSSAIGGYYCAQLARDHGAELLLAGDGGDELFAGNERYADDKKFQLYQRIPFDLGKKIIKPLANLLPPSGTLSYPARYIRRAEIPNPHRLLSYNFFLTHPISETFTPEFVRNAPRVTWLDIAQKHFANAPNASSELNRLLYLDMKMTLADNDIRKVCGTAEMSNIQVRFPLMDRRLVELSASIPSNLKLKGFEKRYIFKRAMKGILPNQILYKKKHGFGVPVGYWMLHDRQMKELTDILDEPLTRQRGYFHPDFIHQIRQLNQSYPAYYGEVLWIILMLELWHRTHATPKSLRRLSMAQEIGSER